MNTRDYWVKTLTKISRSVLQAFSEGKLHETLALETLDKNREKYKGLEILGRTLSGLAPWLENSVVNAEEETLRLQFAELSRRAITSAVDPESEDYCIFSTGEKDWNSQWLVDAAYLALAIIRAPQELYEKLSSEAKMNLTNALRKTRNTRAVFNNWILFAAMVEAGLYVMGEDYDIMRVDYAIRQIEQWYAGDGFYQDGTRFQLDYYNSFVIQPMLSTLVRIFHGNYVEKHPLYSPAQPVGERIYKLTMDRFTRYARVQEMSISPDGSYPPFGRSLVYRCGAFQALAQAALWEVLPKEVSPSMARCGLTKVIKKTIDSDGTFTAEGWLSIGLCGHQPALANPYISTASLYMATLAFLPLGLSENNDFWNTPDEKGTWEKIYDGEDIKGDHPIVHDEILY